MIQELDLRAHTESCADASTRAFDALKVGEGFVLVADHDPISLRYFFEAERTGQFSWESLVANDNGVWKAKLVRKA